MKILHLTLKKQWFDMIASGEKKEEYREIKYYWIERLCEDYVSYGQLSAKKPLHFKSFGFNKFDVVLFKNGYGKNAPTIKIECKGIKVSNKGKKEWGFEQECFVIKLGKILS